MNNKWNARVSGWLSNSAMRKGLDERNRVSLDFTNALDLRLVQTGEPKFSTFLGLQGPDEFPKL